MASMFLWTSVCPLGIDDADVHAPGVQIDAAVESVLLLVESHRGLRGRWMRWSPHSAPQPRRCSAASPRASPHLNGNAASAGSGGHDEYPGVAPDHAIRRETSMSTLVRPDIDCEQHHATLSVSDVRAAAAFYANKLGFDVAFTEGDPPTFAGVNLGRVQIFLEQGHAGPPRLLGVLRRQRRRRALRVPPRQRCRNRRGTAGPALESARLYGPRSGWVLPELRPSPAAWGGLRLKVGQPSQALQM